MNIPYVVSEDIRLLLGYWCDEKNFTLPHPQFFDMLRREFRDLFTQIFPTLEMIQEESLQDGIQRLVIESGLYPVSLDGVYYRNAVMLEISRVVDENGIDAGYGSRGDTVNLEDQYIHLIDHLREKKITEVVLVDDVVFTGSLLTAVTNRLREYDIRVPMVCAGIVINDGTRKLGNPDDRIVKCVYRYRTVADEVCERDFYPGVPLCGRTLKSNSVIGLPYILPFGRPDTWASIPSKWCKQLSLFCLTQTIRIFQEIQQLSDREVLCRDLWRQVITLPSDETPFLDALEGAQKKLIAQV